MGLQSAKAREYAVRVTGDREALKRLQGKESIKRGKRGKKDDRSPIIMNNEPSTHPTSEPATDVLSTSPTSEPATDVLSTSPTSEPATDVLSTSPTSEPATDVLSTRPTSEPATDVLSTSPTSEPATDVLSTSPTSEPATDVLSTSPTSEPATDVLSTRPTSEPATDVLSTRPSSEPTLLSIHGTFKVPQGWFDHSVSNLNFIRLCKVIDSSLSKHQPLVITHYLIIQSNHSWKVYVHDRDVSECPALNSIPQQVNEASAVELLRLVDRLQVCPGHPENKFV